MAKYVEISVATVRGLLVKGWSVNGVWLTHSLDEDAGRSRVDMRDVRGVIDSTDAGVTDIHSASEREVSRLVRMQKAAMAVRASQWICPKGTPRLRPTEVRHWRVMSPEERAALVDDWCKGLSMLGPLITDHCESEEAVCEVRPC